MPRLVNWWRVWPAVRIWVKGLDADPYFSPVFLLTRKIWKNYPQPLTLHHWRLGAEEVSDA